MDYIFNDIKYNLDKDNDKCFDYEEVKTLLTDYFNDFDYVLGDFSYEKIRLKGFYESDNKKVSNINNIKNLDNYIENYCSVGCKWFLLKKMI